MKLALGILKILYHFLYIEVEYTLFFYNKLLNLEIDEEEQFNKVALDIRGIGTARASEINAGTGISGATNSTEITRFKKFLNDFKKPSHQDNSNFNNYNSHQCCSLTYYSH